MLFLYCKEMKLYMSYYIRHIDVYIFDYNCDKIKIKITVLIKGFVYLNPFLLHDVQNVLRFVGRLLSWTGQCVRYGQYFSLKHSKNGHYVMSMKKQPCYMKDVCVLCCRDVY